MMICTLSFHVNIGNQCSMVQVTKCGCVGSYILYLLLTIIVPFCRKYNSYLYLVFILCQIDIFLELHPCSSSPLVEHSHSLLFIALMCITTEDSGNEGKLTYFWDYTLVPLILWWNRYRLFCVYSCATSPEMAHMQSIIILLKFFFSLN